VSHCVSYPAASRRIYYRQCSCRWHLMNFRSLLLLLLATFCCYCYFSGQKGQWAVQFYLSARKSVEIAGAGFFTWCLTNSLKSLKKWTRMMLFTAVWTDLRSSEPKERCIPHEEICRTAFRLKMQYAETSALRLEGLTDCFSTAVNIEILIKFLESRVAVCSAHTNVIKITIPQNGGHFENELLLGGGIRHLTAVLRTQKTSSC